MNDKSKIRLATCLWFDKNAEDAAKFYAATFPDSRIVSFPVKRTLQK